LADEKKYLRGILTESRRSMPSALSARLSDRIQRRLLGSSLYDQAATLVLYAAKDKEPDNWLMLEHALAGGRRVLFPKIAFDNPTLSLIRVRDREELRPGGFGILEPIGTEMVSPALLERTLICVPGVAFSLSGQRLGRGRGYYDRLLAAVHPQAVTVGLAYSFQVLSQLPQSPHDRRLGFIVTPSAIHSATAPRRSADTRALQGGIPRCW
jgi:5-formyltetrahydrofolate cyclo-ligase